MPDFVGLRPTPDRVRETLFNWLQPVIADARCLDLFAGSGMLGLEALSRGAGRVVAVDRERGAVASLQQAAATLGTDRIDVLRGDAMDYLAGDPVPFDVVFLDPPFRSGLLPGLLDAVTGGWLTKPAWVYLECAPEEVPEEVPAGWIPWRDGRAGEVAYRLYRAE